MSYVIFEDYNYSDYSISQFTHLDIGLPNLKKNITVCLKTFKFKNAILDIAFWAWPI